MIDFKNQFSIMEFMIDHHWLVQFTKIDHRFTFSNTFKKQKKIKNIGLDGITNEN